MHNFAAIDAPELAKRIMDYPWKREIDSIHLHHTYRPNHFQWQGEKSMKGMYHYHVVDQGWDDIAMHLVIDPIGEYWVGRDWNKMPASSPGRNGTRWKGPFMIEMVGDFDKGRDHLDGAQLEGVLFAVSYLLWNKRLKTSAIRFHREFRDRTCPGSAIDKHVFMAMIDEFRQVHSMT